MVVSVEGDRQPWALGNLALCLSGGGYRAAAFHLGTLDMLHRLGLLPQVRMLSTVSGGTITGAKYVSALSKKPPEMSQEACFEQFYRDLYNVLLTERLPDQWISQIDVDTRSLIRAVAKTYDDRLFAHQRFEQVIAAKESLHLKEIVFNTTELRTGTNFRFRVGKGGRIGNGNISIPQEMLANVRLADAVAASSCFPGGFEELAFPDDFVWPEPATDALRQSDRTAFLLEITDGQLTPALAKELAQPVPLVDGGIYDNLGVEALLLANRRMKNTYPIGTLIISDTDNMGIEETLMTPLKADLPVPKFIQQVTLQRWVGIIQGVFWLFLLSTIASIVGVVLLGLNGQWAIALLVLWAGIVFGGLTALFWAIAGAAQRISSLPKTLSQRQLRQRTSLDTPDGENILDTLMDIISDWNRLLETVGGLTLAQAYRLILIRLQAIPAIMLAFLKGQRRRNYDSVLDSDRDVDFNVIRNFIRTIRDRKSNAAEDAALLNALTPEERTTMAAIALEATRTPTTLWLDSEPETAKRQLMVLIACGQFTLCYQLLDLFQTNAGTPMSPEMQHVRDRAIAHWEQLKQNPVGLVR